MKKKATGIAAIAFMALGLMASCGNKENTASKAESNDPVEEQEINVQSVSETVEPVTAEEDETMEEPKDGNYFAKIGLKPVIDKGYTTTASGLKYRVVKEGDGAKPKSPAAEVTVHYTGTLLDGTKFDSSVDRGKPTSFPLNRVIAGWTEGLQLMNVGSVYDFIIPADLAYGPRDMGVIKPNSTLYFRVQLLDVNQ